MGSFLLALLLSAASAHPLPPKLAPVDQCVGDPQFARFRTGLKQAVVAKDKKALLAMLSPHVIVDFGGGKGATAFLRQWSFEDSDDPDGIWAVLGRMLSLGCARDGHARVIPSFMVQLDPYQGASEEFALVLPGAKLFQEAGVEAARPKTEPYTIATITSRAGDIFDGVRLPDGRTGLIDDHELYDPLGYRMVVEKLRGKWMITAFVAGD